MRADRLLSLLMLLQARGRMTAPQLARELEVSERTIYRDINALCAAGVPIYGEAGPNGGYALVDSYRTTLTGLTPGETRALFMLSIPQPLIELGVSDDFRSAMRKLAASLPAGRMYDSDLTRQRLYLDSTWWDQSDAPTPHLRTLHRAVIEDHKLTVTYRLPTGIEAEQEIEPYGLVAKAGEWYLIYAYKRQVRARRIAELLDARMLDESVERPADFDLEHFWHAGCADYVQRRSLYHVIIRVAPNFRVALPWHFGDQVRQQLAEAEQPNAEAYITLELAFESFEAARNRILACGRGVEVIAPRALRRSVQDFAEQILTRYAET